jgi:hypothetical protein
MLATMLLRHACDGAATQSCTSCGKVAQPSSLNLDAIGEIFEFLEEG